MEMIQAGKPIDARLVTFKRAGRMVKDWGIMDEKTAPNSCLICNHYKYNHDNYKQRQGQYVHICLFHAPKFVDITMSLTISLNRYCNNFSRRAILP